MNHTVEWISSIFQKVLDSAPTNSRFFRGVERLVEPTLYTRFMPGLMKTLVTLRLARFLDAPDLATSGRSRVMWEEALRRGISMREFRLFGLARELFLTTYQGERKVFIGLPRPEIITSAGLAWADDKEAVREKLATHGVPTARGGVAVSLTQAKKLYAQLRPPLVTKPESGSRSRHTTTHICTEDELVAAFRKAGALSPWVVIEEEDTGFVYRGTLIGEKLVAVLRREPPLVNGDGVRTVAELVADENKNSRRSGNMVHYLEVGEEARAELARQGLTPESVPEKGRVVPLSQKASRGIGGGTTDVTDIVHADTKAMLETAAHIVNDPLLGFDFIVPDITRSWKEQERTGIIECNTLPFIDLHHYPLSGTPRDVAGALWDIVYPASHPKS